MPGGYLSPASDWGAQANDVTQLNQRLVRPACLRSIPEVEAPLGDGSHSLPQPHLSSRGNPFTARYIRQLTMLPRLHMLCIEWMKRCELERKQFISICEKNVFGICMDLFMYLNISVANAILVYSKVLRNRNIACFRSFWVQFLIWLFRESRSTENRGGYIMEVKCNFQRTKSNSLLKNVIALLCSLFRHAATKFTPRTSN
jgi:hypothetical protein